MNPRSTAGHWSRQWLHDYAIVLVLLTLAGFFAAVTWSDQRLGDIAAARQLADQINEQRGTTPLRVFIVARANDKEQLFVDELKARLSAGGAQVVGQALGEPVEVKKQLGDFLAQGGTLDRLACHYAAAKWTLYAPLAEQYPALKQALLMQPARSRGSSFLRSENLLNIANQIAIIAILAIGMTMVIITGGIDLSVGSLIALSAVVCTRLIRDYAQAEQAGIMGMTLSALVAIALCGGCGIVTALCITRFRVPPFIVTVAMMLVASGFAYLASAGQSINQVPDSFIWLGRGDDLLHIPNAVLLTGVLYGAAHALMTRTSMGRHIYAVGGNAEAARLSGVQVDRVLIVVYLLSGLLSGLGGVVMASQLKSGAPTYGQMYELFVIAAVVVGGTSLSGGEGRIFGTLVGALVIAVIQNGMNLTGIESYTQKVVLGTIILAAVILDRLKARL